MGFDTKTVQELELLAAHLRLQVATHPRFLLEREQLKECEQWLAVRRQENEPSPKPARPSGIKTSA